MNRTVSLQFRAMNTDVAVTVLAEPGRHAEATSTVEDVKRWFDQVEATLSRFRPDSDLSHLNRCAGQTYAATPMLCEVLGAALAAAETTGGAFDPTVLPALMAAGYDRSFELLGAARATSGTAARPSGDWRAIDIDTARGTVRLPAGCAIDLGGIGKGWAVDKAAERLAGFACFAIDAGGDLCVRGSQASGAPWTVGIQDPFDLDKDVLVLALQDGAIATSSTARRRWVHNGQAQHHIIDPRTGRPAATGVAAVTVIARSVARCEALAKAALVLGPIEGRLLLQQTDAEGLLILASGEVIASSAAFGITPRPDIGSR